MDGLVVVRHEGTQIRVDDQLHSQELTVNAVRPQLFECQTGDGPKPHCASCRDAELELLSYTRPLSVHKKGAGCMSLHQGLRRSLQLQPDILQSSSETATQYLGSFAIALGALLRPCMLECGREIALRCSR